MAERIRDVFVAEEVAAQAGTEGTPELMLAETIQPVIFAPQRPPLAASGYFPGTIGVGVAGVALNTSHAGIFGSGVGRAITRVNWLNIQNITSGALNFALRRVDSPFTGFPSVNAVPGYINAGSPETGRVFSVTKTDTVAAQGELMAVTLVQGLTDLWLPGPWILNDGILLIACGSVDTGFDVQFGYETWNAIRVQPPG